MAETPRPTLSWPVRCLPRVFSAGQYPMTVPACNRTYRGRTIALHLHDYAGVLRMGRAVFRLQPGDLTLSPANDDSHYELQESGTHLCIHFVPVPAVGKALRLPLHFRPGPQVAAARERFWHVIDHFRQARSPARAAASAALQELLLWLHLRGSVRMTSTRHGQVEETLARLRAVIDASLGRIVTVPELAEQTGLSADYLSRLFSRRHGMTIPHYLLLRRMELARHLLRSTSLPIHEIGRQSGIPDPQYFNKQFRRVVGQSPSVYRRDAGGRQVQHQRAGRRSPPKRRIARRPSRKGRA